MNRHERRIGASLLAAHDKLSASAAAEGFAHWRQERGIANATPEALTQEFTSEEAWTAAEAEVEERATLTAIAILQDHPLRMTEVERTSYLFQTRRMARMLLVSLMREVIDHCAAVVAAGRGEEGDESRGPSIG